MKSLQETLSAISSGGTPKAPALMTHVVLGYPSLKESIEIVKVMADSGASFIELQIPFSDPMADGPTIMRANESALEAGTTPPECMKAAEKLAHSVSVPLLFMSYYNILFSYRGGLKRFCKDASNAGIQGLIVPDIPPEEKADGYWEEAKAHDLVPVPLVSPVTDHGRLKKIASLSNQGFVYCVSVTGTTGARTKLPPGIAQYLKKVKKQFSLPVALGFGISTPSQVASLRGHADIAVVGSATIDLISKTPKSERRKKLGNFIKRLSR